MIDPMANLDPAAPGPELDAPGGDGTQQEVFDMDAYKSNFRKMDKIRSFMGIASGCVGGVCGLTGLSGLMDLSRRTCRSKGFLLSLTFRITLFAKQISMSFHS